MILPNFRQDFKVMPNITAFGIKDITRLVGVQSAR